MPRTFVLLLILLLAACGSIAAETPAQRVYALTSEFTSLQSAALAYIRSNVAKPEIVAQIRRAENTAFTALQDAQKVVRSPGATENEMLTSLGLAAAALNALRSYLVTSGVFTDARLPAPLTGVTAHA